MRDLLLRRRRMLVRHCHREAGGPPRAACQEAEQEEALEQEEASEEEDSRMSRSAFPKERTAVKPDWAALIRRHTRPARDKSDGGRFLTLKKGIIGVSIAAGSARRARIPFVSHSHGERVEEDQSRLTLDVSNEDFLVIRKTREHAVGDTSKRFTVKHYVPWDKIVELIFVERSQD